MQTQSTAKTTCTPYMAYECVPVPFVAIQSAPFKAKDYKEKQYEKKIYKQKLEDFYIKDPTMCIWNGMWWMRKLTNSEYVVQSQWTTSKFRFSAHPHFVLLPSLFIWALLPVCIEFLPYKRTHTVNHPPNPPTNTRWIYVWQYGPVAYTQLHLKRSLTCIRRFSCCHFAIQTQLDFIAECRFSQSLRIIFLLFLWFYCF